MAKKNKKRLSERLQDALNDIVAKQLLDVIDFVHFDRDGDLITSQGTQYALNRLDSEPSYVKVSHWFDVFWYYVNIQVRIRKCFIFSGRGRDTKPTVSSRMG